MDNFILGISFVAPLREVVISHIISNPSIHDFNQVLFKITHRFWEIKQNKNINGRYKCAFFTLDKEAVYLGQLIL